MYHATIPVFVPHLACKNDCVFCNQKRIAGKENQYLTQKELYNFLNDAVKQLDKKFTQTDIAFFGGSFTGIDEAAMENFLQVVKEIKQQYNRITGIRLSTRPDYINDKILNILKEYGVTDIELGAQSMDDGVLKASNRGHNAEDIIYASNLIKTYGFRLVLQMMTGLPKDNYEKTMESGRKIIELKPDGVRIYPCLVIKDTKLEQIYLSGEYVPQNLDQAVAICAELHEMFETNGIKILRIGLHSSDLTKNQSVVAGPFHPAFGELVAQISYYKKARILLNEQNLSSKNVVITVNYGCLSKMIGNKRENIKKLENEFNIKIKVVENNIINNLMLINSEV